MMDAAPLLSVSGLRAGYGRVEVLRDVSLTVRDGQFVTIIGANGAGKTTLLKAIMGLIPATGEVKLRDLSLLGEPAHRRVALGIGYVPEGRRVFPSLTVEENLRLTAVRQKGKGADRSAIQLVYEMFPRLRERRTQAAGSLSGGEQQMLALGRALVLAPQVLIADEVSLGLAPVVVDRLFDVLGDMHRRGTTIVLAEQNARLALEAADEAYVLEAGRVLLHGPAGELRTDPRIVDAYLQSL
jgi:branched-chain amino acid transport system ATP-binding protein